MAHLLPIMLTFRFVSNVMRRIDDIVRSSG